MLKNKFHSPIQQNLDYIKKQIKDGAKVLEIGPGFDPFEKATHFCGWTQEENSRLKIFFSTKGKNINPIIEIKGNL